MANEKREAKFWDCRDSERLTHTSMDDAIEDILSDGGDMPDVLEVCGYAPVELPSADVIAGYILDETLDRYDEEYGDPDACGGQKATPRMIEASMEFARVFREEFSVWMCECVERITIDVSQWVKENRPDWLEESQDE